MKSFISSAFFFLLSTVITLGQCAMCKATLETKTGEESYIGVGAGINAGVLYLMVVPYLLMIGAVFLFRYKKKKGTKAVAI